MLSISQCCLLNSPHLCPGILLFRFTTIRTAPLLIFPVTSVQCLFARMPATTVTWIHMFKSLLPRFCTSVDTDFLADVRSWHLLAASSLENPRNHFYWTFQSRCSTVTRIIQARQDTCSTWVLCTSFTDRWPRAINCIEGHSCPMKMMVFFSFWG